jgi:glycosyltransferase involved in cell wall biosynthesis
MLPTVSSARSLAIAQVTPYPWESGHEANRYVAAVARELVGRGHRVAVVAPSSSSALVREGRRAVRAGGDGLFRPSGEDGAGGFRVLAVGEALPPLAGRAGGRAGGRAMPIDVARTLEALFEHDALDLCHVHDPFAPSVASVALRHSRALNVGGFHAPPERLVAAQVAPKLARLVLGRLDVRLADYAATRRLVERAFPGRYDVLAPAAVAPEGGPGRADDGRVRLLYVEEERAALRLFLRALRHLDPDLPWEATVVSARGPSSSTPLRAAVRGRVRFADPLEEDVDALLGAADVLVAASEGLAPSPGLLRRAAAAGAVPVAARLEVYEDALDYGRGGLLFEPRDEATLIAQLGRAVADAGLRARLRAQAPRRSWAEVTDDLEAVYAGLVARRHDDRARPDLRTRLRGRRRITVDLHMHTDHSSDCATPVEVLLATARDQGLGAIAVTDHNEVSGAFDAQRKADRFGVKVIVGEEVKTADQGEVIGLFLTERIPRGMTLQETVDEIKRQGGVVYVPHPFDRMHSVPDYEHLLAVVDDVDAIEVYNPRVAIGSFNEEAARFAAKYRIPAGAGSDAHVAQGLGSVRIAMPDFDGPEEFLEALRMADITTKPSSLLYVQALKFLETKATPAGVRRARRTRRVERATRKA